MHRKMTTPTNEYVLDMPYPPGSVLLLDNCAVHKNIDYIYDTKGYIPLFLSPYSPDFQPVELAFSKIKTYFRQIEDKSDICACVERCIQEVCESDIKGYFRHAHRKITVS